MSYHNAYYKVASKYGTSDKVSTHGYHRFYDPLILPWQQDSFKMLEIGVERGSSIRTWLDYFPNAYIYGLDIGPTVGVELSGERHTIFIGDQSNQPFLQSCLNSIGEKLRIIIDDGSHVPHHQLTTFNLLFKHGLEPGGLYILEDIETSYWKQGPIYGYNFEAGYRHPQSIIECFKSLVDNVNRPFLSPENQQKHDTTFYWPIDPDVRSMVGSIGFGQNCIWLKKKTEDDAPFDNRVYPFSDKL